METVTDFIFLGTKITADGDCSHEIKRWLLLGRKAMTNLDSILKSRAITLSTKVHLGKAMVFPVAVQMWELDHKDCWATKSCAQLFTDYSMPVFPVLISPGVCSNSCPLSRWCHPIISFSVTPFSSCPWSFPASGSFLMSWHFPSSVQILELQLQHQPFQWIFRVDFL